MLGSNPSQPESLPDISLREATDDDLELLMAWRSNPLVYQGFYIQKEPLTWHEHYTWWKSRRNRKDWIVLLNEKGAGRRRAVGSVNVSSLDRDTPEVGIYIGETTLWGKGTAYKAVRLALQWLLENGYKKVRASILMDNERSLNLFEGLGFKLIGYGRENELLYQLHLARSFK